MAGSNMNCDQYTGMKVHRWRQQMPDTAFLEAVVIQVVPGTTRAVKSAEEAADTLMRFFPNLAWRDECYIEAANSMVAAIEGRGGVEFAGPAFIRAAAKSQMPSPGKVLHLFPVA